MVRLKHRYLLVKILYPEEDQTHNSALPLSTSKSILHIHRPTPDGLTPALLAKIIRECVGELFGDWGVGRLGGANAGRVIVKYLSSATSTAIIRCPRESYRLVAAALALLNAIPVSKKADAAPAALLTTPITATTTVDRIPCVFQVVRVSGTIKKAEEEAIRRARREVAQLMSGGATVGGSEVAGEENLLDKILGTTKSNTKEGGVGSNQGEDDMWAESDMDED